MDLGDDDAEETLDESALSCDKADTDEWGIKDTKVTAAATLASNAVQKAAANAAGSSKGNGKGNVSKEKFEPYQQQGLQRWQQEITCSMQGSARFL